ncbi:hypothetical protein [Streptomyces lydicus]|uniref:hypothetical protein n=1 Tax=Streptomyces lydicus TaxID=47763 RepID=UPI00378935FB
MQRVEWAGQLLVEDRLVEHTVYYNNHCLGGTRVTAAFKFYNDGSTPFYKCVTFQGDSQGKYKFAHINEIMDVNKDTKKCKNN